MTKEHIYYLEHECDCGQTIKKRCLFVGPEDGPVIFMQGLGQQDFQCPDCNTVWSYGDIEYINATEEFGTTEAFD